VIVTVTPNPSIDRTLRVPVLRRGEVVRATATTSEAGGKGINVARALDEMGVPAIAIAPASGATRARLDALLGGHPPLRLVPIDGEIRTNLSLTEPDGTVTKVNESGPVLSAAEVEALETAVVTLAGKASWLVCSGSLPQGVPDALYANVVRRARALGARIAVDASGPAFAAAVAEAPDLVKPNHEELAELVGRPLPTLGDVLATAQSLVSGGIRTVLVSLGARGALLVEDGTVLHGSAVVAAPRSNVGAGDSTLAGYLVGDSDPKSALARAVAYGAAAVSLPGSAVPGPDDLQLDLVTVTDQIDPDLQLSD
jgi:1-phosphofructokinase